MMTQRRYIGVIARKELSEMLRERKTIVLMLLLPLILYPLLFGSLLAVNAYNQSQIQSQEPRIALCGDTLPVALREQLVEGVTLADCELDGDPQLTLEYRVSRGAEDRPTLHVSYDGSSEAARAALSKVKGGIDAWREGYRVARLAEVGLTVDALTPAEVSIANSAPPARQGGWLLGQILPMLVSLLMIGASFHPAVDLTAGERERGTFETLMTAPVSALDLVTGKFVAVVALTLGNGLVNVGAIVLMAWLTPIPDSVAGEVSFAIPLVNGLLVFVTMVCLGMMFGALALAVSVTTTTLKEAQGYWTPVYLLCMLPLVASSVPGVTLTAQTALIPVLNLALAMKSLLLGDLEAWLLSEVLISTLIWTLLGLIAAAQLFASEEILMGSEGVSVVFRRRPVHSKLSTRPVVAEALLVFGVTMLLLFYGGLLTVHLSPLWAIQVSQWACLLAPTVLLAWWLRLGPHETFSLAAPKLIDVLIAVAVGASLWIPASWAMETFILDALPEPNQALQDFVDKLMALADEPRMVPLLFFSIAVVPAVCEELVFRGFILGALSSDGRTHGPVWGSALMFAIVHMNPLQFPTTFLLGGVLGYLTLASRSVWPAVVLHALHNGAVLAFQLWGEEAILSPLAYVVSLGLCGVSLIALGRRLSD